MQQDDLFQYFGVLAKLNRTIDGQQQVIDAYMKKYGPLDLSEGAESQKEEKKEATS